jgi:predicted nuclease with TOPRIM domain
VRVAIAYREEDTRRTLNELLQLSEGLQRRSDELAAEAEQLRDRISRLLQNNGSPRAERRRKPRLKGK